MTRPLTIGGLVSLLVAFPTVLAYKIAHLSYDAIPFKARRPAVFRAPPSRAALPMT